ncbi:MAG: NAD(P)/FAD-dependent oxidoreductase [Bacteroidales bacterium]|nr:NAD(P)/FAD-dependent oxidoreductase [Bacteroidales bacterium]
MSANIPVSAKKRVVIAGAGFAGLKLASSLNRELFQVVLIDKNNYHQFQPLFYQVATAGLEPSAISFPLRKIFQHTPDTIIRVADILEVKLEAKLLLTSLGEINYDYLVIATGAETNFFGMEEISKYAIPMKSVSEALSLRNQILQNFEDALIGDDPLILPGLLTVVVVGGGPTGVEVSGTLAEMKRYILPKDYPELDFSLMNIFLLEAGDKLLSGMSNDASQKATEYLQKLGVRVMSNAHVTDYDGMTVLVKNQEGISSRTVVWAAGIKGNSIPGIGEKFVVKGNRIRVNRYNAVEGISDVYAIGDVASMNEPAYPDSHPQMAQPAIQQAKLLANNLERLLRGKPLKEFKYSNRGSMATVGRNLAVVDLPFWHFHGFFAWLTWMFVHLMAIVGVKNRLLIFINWFWNYVTYDQSLRLIIKPFKKNPQG